MKKWWAARSTRTRVIIVVIGILIAVGIANSGNKPNASVAASATPTRVVAIATTAAPTTAVPTAPPTATPKPAATPFHFGSGQKNVGTDLPAGTYRTRQASPSCYWQRLSGFGGTISEIIANGNTNGPAVVTIAASDKGFDSTRCAEWSADLSAISKAPTDPFGEGTLIVGTDIAPGTWHNSGTPGCSWQRMSGFTGGVGDIIANGNTDTAVNVTIGPGDKGFSSARCGTWTKVG